MDGRICAVFSVNEAYCSSNTDEIAASRDAVEALAGERARRRHRRPRPRCTPVSTPALHLVPHDAGLPLRLRRRREAAAAQGRNRRSQSAQLADGCPYHKHTTTVSSDELSEFGHELERDGRQPEAVACYALAIRNHPSKAIGWFDLATAWQYSDRANALKYYAHGLKLQPADGFRYSQLGVLLRAAERGEAVRRFEQAVRLLPDDADAYFHLGVARAARAAGGRAARLPLGAGRRAQERGADPEQHRQRARPPRPLGRRLGRVPRGEAEADPELAETQFNLAHVHTSLGRLDEAERHVRAAQRLSPADRRATRKAEEWEHKVDARGRASGARASSPSRRRATAT